MISTIVAICFMWYSASFFLATIYGHSESKSGMKILEKLYWGYAPLERFRRLDWLSAKKKALERVDSSPLRDWIIGESIVRQKAVDELRHFEAANRAMITKSIFLIIPGIALSMSSALFVLDQGAGGDYSFLLAMLAGIIPVLLLILLSTALTSESYKRPTGCYVVNAVFAAASKHKTTMNSINEVDRKSFEIPTVPLAQSLESAALSLTIFGTHRIRPNGRRNIPELVIETERTANYLRTLSEQSFLEGPDTTHSLPEKLASLLTNFVLGRYGHLAPRDFQPTTTTPQSLPEERSGRRGLALAAILFSLSAILLTWSGLSESIIAGLMLVLAPPALHYFRVRDHSNVRSSSNSSGE